MPPSEYYSCEANWVVLCCGLKLISGCIGSGPLGRCFCASHSQLLPVTIPGTLPRSYRAIHN